MDEQKSAHTSEDFSHAEFAEISESCREKITQCEKELNKQGYWNIALVAYQIKD